MRIRRPSPAMVVALIALFVALGGTSVAAVSFARNAGAVDGKSAVFSGATLKQAAGKLVATNRSGPDKGRIPSKFLAGAPHSATFARVVEVADNTPGAAQGIASAAPLGSLTATCNDQNARAGLEDPVTQIAFVNSSGQTVNVARRVGIGDGVVSTLANQTVAPVVISGSNTFEYHVQANNVNVLVSGAARQEGARTPSARCVIYGTVMTLI